MVKFRAVACGMFGTPSTAITAAARSRPGGDPAGVVVGRVGLERPAVMGTLQPQFWSGGYEGTSTYDLMEATGLGKGSLYKAYGSKHELYLRTFDDYCQRIVAEARQSLAPAAGASPLERIEG